MLLDSFTVTRRVFTKSGCSENSMFCVSIRLFRNPATASVSVNVI
jgi:hypothetical protein